LRDWVRMNKSKKPLVPKLRFPEFRDDNEWKIDILKNISPSIFDGTHQTPKYIESGIPFFSVENIVSGNKNKFISREDYLVATSKNKPDKGDILITRIGNIGYSVVINWDYEFGIYVTLAVVKKSVNFNSNFLNCYFQSKRYQVELHSKSLLNAVPCKINMDELRKTEVLLPTKKEQQKIADCLTSLDELITAETQKLEAYKAHKKGLMQQLFPAKGETVPGLRFPEFRDSEDWSNDQFGTLYSFKGTNSLSREKLNYENGSIKNIHYGDIHKKFATLFDIEKELVPFIDPCEQLGNIKDDAYCMEGDIIFADASEDLEDVGKSIELINLNNERLLSGLHTLLARKKTDNFIIGFIGYLLKSSLIRKQIQRESQGAKVLGISAGRLANIRVFFPEKAEQQKIADCLSSLDELITAQAQKVETIKAHKKGLMQGLFPSADEVSV
jgi:type I restriction enzyme S subunit